MKKHVNTRSDWGDYAASNQDITMGCVASKLDINDVHPNMFAVNNVDNVSGELGVGKIFMLQGDHLVRSLKFCFTTPIEIHFYWFLIGSNSSQTWSIWYKSLFAWYFSLYDPNSTSPFRFKKIEKLQNWHIWAMIDFQKLK